VAADKEAYIRLAVELARDPHLLAEMRAQVAARRDRLYRDTDVIAALEAFYAATVSGGHLAPHRGQP
jgi:predicted O-linked N-acetylglucosamine transferase (SPINDLY family)